MSLSTLRLAFRFEATELPLEAMPAFVSSASVWAGIFQGACRCDLRVFSSRAELPGNQLKDKLSRDLDGRIVHSPPQTLHAAFWQMHGIQSSDIVASLKPIQLHGAFGQRPQLRRAHATAIRSSDWPENLGSTAQLDSRRQNASTQV